MASERNRLLIPEDFIETGSTGIGNFIQRPDLKYNRPVICNTNTSTHINESFETRASVVKDDNITVTDNCLLKCLNPSNVICNKCFNFKSSVNVSVKEETRLTSDFPPVTLISKLKPFSVGFDDGTFNAKMCFSISKENELDTGTVKTQPVTLKKPHLLTPDSFIISPKSLDSSTLPDIPRVPDTLFEAQDSVNKLSISTNNIEISSHPQSKFLFVSPSNKRSEVKLGDIKSSLIKEHQLLEDELNKEAALSNPNGIYDEDDDIKSLSVRRKLQFDTPSENERLKTAREKSFIKNERINTVRDRPTGFLENERIETAGDSFRGNESLKPARDKFLNNERINTVRDRGYLENERTETARDSFHGNERINTAREKYFAGFQCSLKIPDNIYDNFSLEEKDNGVSSKFSFTRNPFPPIGVFWDIENCRIPKGLSATHVVQAIRNRFFDGYKEAEFICVCDTLKENPKVLEELNDAQVNIMHVGSIVKNAADDKLLQSMRRFADIHGAGSSIILISGDSDFATELYDLRYRKKLHVILVHNAHAQDSLKLSAHETALFSDVTQELPQRNLKNKCSSLSKEVMVWNMPNNVDQNLIRRRLHILASNCGGKYIQVQRNSAKIAFNTPELAARAKKRIDGESVYGSKVFCTFGKLNDRNDRGSRVRQLDPVFVQRAEYSSTRESERKYPFLPESTEFDMDFSNKSFWNKSSESSNSNMNDSYCTSWRMPSPAQNMNGHSFNSSPAFNSSSQSNSSRENSPSFFINRNGNGDSFNPSSQLLPPSKECQTQNYVDDFPYPSQGYNTRSVWPPENRNGTFPSSNQLSNPLPSFSNLSMKESSQVEEKEKEQKITLVDRSSINELWLKTRKLLWDEPSCSLPMKKFVDVFTKKYNQALDIEVLKNDLQEYLQFKENGEDCLIQLVPLQVFARDLLIMLSEAGGRMLLMNFECAYLNRFGVACRPASYGFPNLTVLMQNIGDMVHLKGKKMKRIIALNKTKVPDLPNYCPPPPAQPQTGVKEKISKYGVPYMPVPPPPQNSFTQAQRGPPPPATPPCDQRTYSKDVVGSRVVMGLTPPPQQTYHPPHSPVLYSGSPVATGGSVVWGQVWSPQYSVMPQLSPAHYMVPTVPMNWNNMPLSSVAPGSKPAEGGAVCRRKNPVSIKTLEEIEKGLPPNASELPSPELLTQNEDVASDSTLK